MDDLDHLLAGMQALEDLLPGRPLLDPRRELLGDLVVDVGLEEREPDFAQPDIIDHTLLKWTLGITALIFVGFFTHSLTGMPVAVPAGLAHVYTECARIWNPIHTDVAVARATGLPDIILHGTATLALAVSRVLGHLAADPRAVRRVRARFTGMVSLPGRFTLRVAEAAEGKTFGFDARGDDGALVLSAGALDLSE